MKAPLQDVSVNELFIWRSFCCIFQEARYFVLMFCFFLSLVNYLCITNFPLNVISFKQNSFAYVVVLCNNKSLAELLTSIILYVNLKKILNTTKIIDINWKILVAPEDFFLVLHSKLMMLEIWLLSCVIVFISLSCRMIFQ